MIVKLFIKFVFLFNHFTYVWTLELYRYELIRKGEVSYNIGASKIMNNVQSKLHCIVECKQEKTCVAVQFQQSIRECQIIYTFSNTLVSKGIEQ